MRDFAQMLANYVYNLQAASAVEQWEQDQYEKRGRRPRHLCNPGTGNWCNTLPKAPAWFVALALRDVVKPLLAHEGLATPEELAARYPDHDHGEDLAQLAYNLANSVTGDGGGDFANGGPGLDIFMKLDPQVWVGPTAVRLHRPRKHPAQ